MTRVDIETIIADFHAGRADRDPFDEIQALITELRRTEGDLAVAVAEAQAARAQRQAALALCDKHEHGALRWEDSLPVPEWIPLVRAALGVCPVCDGDLGATRLCPSCEQAVTAQPEAKL